MKLATHVKDCALTVRRHRVAAFVDGVLQPTIDQAAINGEETTPAVEVPENVDMFMLQSFVEGFGYKFENHASEPRSIVVSWSHPSR